ncbi:MAG: tRNA (adenosine(37)-N6)-threonylcarbamoyltransferase complex ATPase subunit type 1 TsaE [Bdellovibrionaceae bacterium]|nr:tRNA (adenosine(37)-N6)-threonylcarbamoyltransferase complex ATPase subunit type 1 TsaE [Pseudobdellovibrionaceae bacterium]
MSEDIKLVSSVKDLNCWISEEFINKLSSSKKDVILLNGPLGVGKTQWVSLFVKQMFGDQSLQSTADNEEAGNGEAGNVKKENVTSSPTFSLHNVYQKAGLTIHHFDLYRLSSENELESFNFWDVFKEDNAYVIIEWSKKFSILKFFPGWQVHNIDIDFLDKNSSSRQIKYTKSK